MRIGVFSGSFNPPHTGHLVVVESVRDQLRLEKVIWIPSAQPPNKPDAVLAPPDARFEMTRLAAGENSCFEASDIELRRSGPSYTVDTIDALAAFYPGATLILIIGADNFLEFSTWKSPEEILAKADLAVMSRPGFSVRESKQEIARMATFVNVPQIGISGTDIRRRVKLGRSIRYLVPRAVESYIQTRHLYRD